MKTGNWVRLLVNALHFLFEDGNYNYVVKLIIMLIFIIYKNSLVKDTSIWKSTIQWPSDD